MYVPTVTLPRPDEQRHRMTNRGQLCSGIVGCSYIPSSVEVGADPHVNRALTSFCV